MSLREYTKIVVVDNGRHYLDILGRWFTYCDIVVRSRNTFVSAHAGRADAVIFSDGNGPFVGNESLYAQQIDFVKKASVPILGIGLGSRLIAHAFGAQMELAENRGNSVIMISPSVKSDLFEGIKTLAVYENQRWMPKILPSELEGWASSSQGYEIIKHKKRPLYGFQFHPEMVVNPAETKKIFLNILNLFKRSE